MAAVVTQGTVIGHEIAAEEINAKGGVLDRKIEAAARLLRPMRRGACPPSAHQEHSPLCQSGGLCQSRATTPEGSECAGVLTSVCQSGVARLRV
jgi:hypothetical protein